MKRDKGSLSINLNKTSRKRNKSLFVAKTNLNQVNSDDDYSLREPSSQKEGGQDGKIDKA